MLFAAQWQVTNPGEFWCPGTENEKEAAYRQAGRRQNSVDLHGKSHLDSVPGLHPACQLRHIPLGFGVLDFQELNRSR